MNSFISEAKGRIIHTGFDVGVQVDLFHEQQKKKFNRVI